MNLLSKNISYAVEKIGPLINGICNGSIIIHINLGSKQIIISGKIDTLLGLCNTSHVDSGDQYYPNLK